MRSAALAELGALAEARKSRDLARLEALIAEARGIEDEIAELARTPVRDFEEAAGAWLPLAYQAQRAAWAEAAIAARRKRLLRLAHEIAAARRSARRSLGKHEAIAALTARAAGAERIERERAEEIAAFAAEAGRRPGRPGE